MEDEGYAGGRRAAQDGKQRSEGPWLRSPGWLGRIQQGLLLLFILVVAGCQGAGPRPSQGVLKHGVPQSSRGTGGAVIQQAESWRTFGYDAAAGQVNAGENVLTAATVRSLRQAWSVTLPDLADERPILLRHLAWPDGRLRDVLYLTTDNGTLLALDADSGAQLWAATPKNTNPKYTKASPAADPVQGLIYSYGLDGKVHRFRATTGQEVTGNGWPVRVTKMPLSEKVSAALNLANGYLYVTTASFSGDAPPYQGHLVAINVKTGATHVFNSLCNDHTHLLALGECAQNGGGIWGRPGVVVDPATGNIFFTVSDALFTANRGGADWGDSVIEMTPDGAKVVDSYTPDNFATEAFQNRDLGSVAPVLLPDIPASRTPELAVQGGKEGLLRLLNRQNLSGQGGPAHVGGELQTVTVPDDCPILAQPLAWQDSGTGAILLIVADSCHMDGYQVLTSAQGVTTLHLAWSVAGQTTSPILAGGVLFAAMSHALLALDPHTGHVLWSSALPAAGGDIGAVHWESPIVVAGRLYCTDEANHLMMYQLPA
ncbi:MAG TPA: PQQ-binding-like beta-propeller repeat protein [Ktedonobacterales bacterium]|nr:PQQ-binding-like beta-propeller repeat protein [Ktedonobacterales bacterium]